MYVKEGTLILAGTAQMELGPHHPFPNKVPLEFCSP